MSGLVSRPGLLAGALAVATLTPSAHSEEAFVIADVGIDFSFFNGRSGRFFMPEITGGGGVALFDFDGDSDLDVYFAQGQLLAPADVPLLPARHPLPSTDRLYRNELVPEGRLRFTDVTVAAGLEPAGYGFGVAAGDYDGDGRTDLYVTRLGSNSLLRNRGDGTFEDMTAAAGVDDPGWSVPALFADFDADGRLDLYVGNYLDFTVAGHKACRSPTGILEFCGPTAYPGVGDRLFRNRGDGTFEDVSSRSGILRETPKSLGAVAADLDGDGRLDLYVASDQTPNLLWLQGPEAWSFREEGLLAGCAVNGQGKAEASMGVDAVDVDDDGDLDLFMTNLVREHNTLFVNDGGGFFEDRSNESGLGLPSWNHTAWGTAWLDYDNDGLQDVLVANGAVLRIEALAAAGDPFPYHETSQLFRGLGGGRFVEASEGKAFELSMVGRGLAAGDLDNDGDVDAILIDNHGPARVLVNRVGQDRAWLGLRVLTAGGRDALGARVEVRQPGKPVRRRRVHADGSYASSRDPRVLVGLGEDPAPATVVVHWVEGGAEEWEGLAARRYHTLRRGEGRPLASAPPPPGDAR